MVVELNEAVDAQAFQQVLAGAVQQYQEVQREIMDIKAGYDVPIREADIPPAEVERLERLETRASVIEDTITYWNEDAERGYNLLS